MDWSVVLRSLSAEREATLERVRDATREFDAIVAASADTNADDEHDPEGSTIAYERAKAAASLAHQCAAVAELDQAFERVATGRYGICVDCGDAIAPERLAARPAAPACIGCAVHRR